MAAAQGTYNPLLSKKMPREYKRQLSKDDIGNQARVLLNHFIHDRISREQGEEQVPSTEELQEPGTPT
ncbi:Hypothetical predicted protein, partial [Mytilus galloprovincialis]